MIDKQMKKRGILYFLFFIILIPFISAAPQNPVFQSSDPTETLNIILPGEIYTKLNRDFKLDVHVTNSSGALINSPDCEFHLYNRTDGNYLIKDNFNKTSDKYEYLINDSIIKEPGNYPFGIFCNDSEHGYITAFITYNVEGRAFPESMLPIGIIIILPLVLGIIAALIMYSFNDEQWPFKAVFLLLSLLSFVISLFLSLIVVDHFYYDSAMTFTVLSLAIPFAMLWLLLMVYFSWIIIQSLIDRFRQKRIEKWRGKPGYEKR